MMKRSLFTRILHTALTVAILHQLVISWVMERPKPGGAVENVAFTLHEVVGLASLGTLALFWIWVMFRRREQGFAGLFPWFFAERRRAVFEDIGNHARSLANHCIPDPTGETPLASAVHGLGLLVATAMAISGAIIYAFTAADGSLTDTGRIALHLHSALANLMWAYLIGHAGIAIVHETAGHHILQRMFVGESRRSSGIRLEMGTPDF